MTLTQFVQTVKMMRDAQENYKERNSVKWLVQKNRMERLVDNIIREFFSEQVRNMPKEGNLFPPD